MIYLLVGVPGSGKTWVTDQLKDKFKHIPHDEYIGQDYAEAIVHARMQTDKPLLIETPFSISQIVDELNAFGYKVVPIFIIEDEEILGDRWAERGTALTARAGHLTRQQTYLHRARKWRAFVGTSAEVLEHLKGVSDE